VWGLLKACGITTNTFPKSTSALGSIRSTAPQTQTRLIFPDDGVVHFLPHHLPWAYSSTLDSWSGLTWLLQQTSRRARACTPSLAQAPVQIRDRARNEGALLPVLPLVSPRGPVERSWPLLTEAKSALCGARPLDHLPIRISVAVPSQAYP